MFRFVCSFWKSVALENQRNLLHLPGILVRGHSKIGRDFLSLEQGLGGAPRLAFCRLEDKVWTPIKVPRRPHKYPWYKEVIYHKDKFYALNSPGGIDFFYITSSSTEFRLIEFVPPPRSEIYLKQQYPVEIESELLLVTKTELYEEEDNDDNKEEDTESDYDSSKKEEDGPFVEFGIYKQVEPENKWMAVESIDMDLWGCKVGIYNLENQTFEILYGNESTLCRPASHMDHFVSLRVTSFGII
ncbi:hypothetical protein GIB67_042869 [Kingdonia uniflora]|uniref:KIB1-4 beta-propeller domain-containing protein n=1 Tax=Kingdonia uniflora TaxID=39325 RepID=A0A7J7NSV2_9MAGN|nr:hypothetical protein GIB67_042869 [Kingdonia uniflora]